MNEHKAASLSTQSHQTPMLTGYNPRGQDEVLQATVNQEEGAWIEIHAQTRGALAGSEHMQSLAKQANRSVPQLRAHDRGGDRIDSVDYHPAYHSLRSLALGPGLNALAWTELNGGAFVGRAALNLLWHEAESGTSCPVTMAIDAVQAIRHEPLLDAQWEPKMFTNSYNSSSHHLSQKKAVIVGMDQTQKQAGNDLRTTRTTAVAPGGGEYAIAGHKWFCSAPMSDSFFAPAQTEMGISCILMPQLLPDESRDKIHVQRRKEKCGNRSNASTEVKYHDVRAQRIGENGRGISALLETAPVTRFDSVFMTAGRMRGALHQSIHQCEHRDTFGKRWAAQPLVPNVLADLSQVSEVAIWITFQLPRVLDEAPIDSNGKLLAGILRPAPKHRIAERSPAFMAEAMERFGENGYAEEKPLARFYRDAPLNRICESSGNVTCADILRSLQKQAESATAKLAEICDGNSEKRPLPISGDAFDVGLTKASDQPLCARPMVEMVDPGLQGSLMAKYAFPASASAFLGSRAQRQWEHALGNLPDSSRCKQIINSDRLG